MEEGLARCLRLRDSPARATPTTTTPTTETTMSFDNDDDDENDDDKTRQDLGSGCLSLRRLASVGACQSHVLVISLHCSG